MRKLGKKQLTLSLRDPLTKVPESLASMPLTLSDDGRELNYNFDSQQEHSGISELLKELDSQGVEFRDLRTRESSLEDIFVGLVHGQ